jgi:hypothetical protein
MGANSIRTWSLVCPTNAFSAPIAQISAVHQDLHWLPSDLASKLIHAEIVSRVITGG